MSRKGACLPASNQKYNPKNKTVLNNDISTPKLTMFYLCVLTMPIQTLQKYMHSKEIIKKLNPIIRFFPWLNGFFFLFRKDFRMYVLTPKHPFSPVFNPVKWSPQKATNLVSNIFLSGLILFALLIILKQHVFKVYLCLFRTQIVELSLVNILKS